MGCWHNHFNNAERYVWHARIVIAAKVWNALKNDNVYQIYAQWLYPRFVLEVTVEAIDTSLDPSLLNQSSTWICEICVCL